MTEYDDERSLREIDEDYYARLETYEKEKQKNEKNNRDSRQGN